MATKKAASNTKKDSTVKSRSTTTTVKSAPVTQKSAFGQGISDSVRSLGLWRALAAELLGTFMLASVVIAGQGQPIFVLFGLVGIVLLFGAVSGAHVNPAVTIGAWVTRRINWLRALGYILAQLLGAALAFVVLSHFVNGAPAVSEEAALYGQAAPELFKAALYTAYQGKEWYVFFAEILGAGVLAFAVANAIRAGKERLTAAFTVGFGIFVALMVAVSAAGYVGASVAINPAVALALQAFSWENLWPFVIYAIAPVIGGILGFIIHDAVVAE